MHLSSLFIHKAENDHRPDSYELLPSSGDSSATWSRQRTSVKRTFIILVMISTPLLSLVAFLFYVYPAGKTIQQLPESAAEGFAEGVLTPPVAQLPPEVENEDSIGDLEEELEEINEEQEQKEEGDGGKQEEEVKLPTYERFYEMERNYPQHDKNLPYPEGENGRFVWVSNQHWGLGWNNIFQPLYMMSLVAYLSGRAHVFEPYVWDITAEGPAAHFGDNIIPARIPLAALVAGPVAGGSFPPDDLSPRAVNKEFYDQVCPDERRVSLSIEQINSGLKGRPVLERVEKYVEALRSVPEGCVVLSGWMEHPFDWTEFADHSIVDVYPTFANTPILKDFDWSSLILQALHTNAELIAPSFHADPLPDLVSDIMALHLRRGDYKEHCPYLAVHRIPFEGWNTVPGMASSFTVPSEGEPELEDTYRQHCFPTIEEIVIKVRDARSAWERRDAFASGVDPDKRHLKRLFIATNGKKDWIKELELALRQDGEWDVFVSSRDLVLTDEQRYVAQAVDMAIAQRAAVFIGNGFSSMSANINLIRRVRGHPLISSWFW